MSEHIIDHYSSQIPILPGEFLPAYIARLVKMTAGVDSKKLMSFSGSAQLGKLHQLFPRVASNFAYRKSVRDHSGALLKEHMGARYWRGFVAEQDYRAHVEQVRTRIKSKRSIFEGEEVLDALKPMKFCPDCRHDDIETLGAPIWRANHQITSVYFCEKHGKPLRNFHLKLGKTLLDYPVITDEVMYNSEAISPNGLREWLDRESRELLDIPSIHNRERVSDLKSSMASALGAREAARGMGIDISYRNEWRKYLSEALTNLCPKENCYGFFSGKANFGLIQQLKQNAPVRHPLVFLLAMKFTEELSGFKVS